MRQSILQRTEQDSDAIYDEDFCQLLGQEWQSIIIDAMDNIATLTNIQTPQLEQFTVTAQLKLIASVSLDAQLSPSFTFSYGTMLSIDDLILTACCHDQFFFHLDQKDFTDIDYALVCGGEEVDFAGRFFNYEPLFETNASVPLNKICGQFPVTQWRLHQASFLSGLALEWITMHELTHWLFGHCQLRPDKTIDEACHLFTLDIDPPTMTVDIPVSKCIELQADGLAFELMFYHAHYYEFSSQKWADCVGELDATFGDDNAGIIDFNDDIQRLRALIVASAAAILIMEKARVQTNGQDIADYPKPITRLTNIYANAFRIGFYAAGCLNVNDKGEMVLKSDNRDEYMDKIDALFKVIGESLFDIAYMAKMLTVEDALYDGRLVDFTDLMDVGKQMIFFDNLQLYMNNKDIPQDKKTEGYASFAEFLALLPVQQELAEQLSEVSMIDFEAMTNGEE